jgi:hypoxanthine phosphoribosyltransferase
MPTTRSLDWTTFERLCESIARRVEDERIDLVVGVARGGLPPAVWLSHRLDTGAFGTVLARKTTSEEAFALDRESRLTMDGSVLPACAPSTILVVDDVVAYGDLFAAVEGSLRDRYGEDVCLRPAALFADRAQIGAGPYAPLLDTLVYGEDIDNTSVWIDFPWEQCAA